MALTRVKTWASKERVTAADLNTEFNNILDYLNAGLQGTALASDFVAQGNFDMNFNDLRNVQRIGNLRFVWVGQNVQTIVDEIASSENGGTVVLMPGTHDLGSTTVVVPDSVNLIGWALGPVKCTSTASTILQISTDSQSESQQIGGFQIETVAGNSVALDITGGANFATNIHIFNLHVQNGFAGAGCTGINGGADVDGVRITQCAFDACQFDVVLGSGCSRWVIDHNYFSTSGISSSGASIDLSNGGVCNTVRNNYITADANCPNAIDMSNQVAANITGNLFDGAAPQSLEIGGTGGSKAGTSRACVVEHNSFEGSGTSAIDLSNGRACAIRHNYFGSEYTNACLITAGGENRGNFWGPNDVDSTNELNGTRREVIPFALFAPNEFANAYVSIIPHYASSPTEVGTSFGSDEYGFMWAVDADIDSSGAAQSLHYYDYAGNDTSVAFT